jgi:predicted phage terminase large subunit-like protein
LGERCVIERIIDNAQELGFKGLRVPVMIDGVPTWEAKQNLQEIEAEKEAFAKLGKLDIWYAEKMCQSVSEETRTFKDEDYRYFSPSRLNELKNDCNVFACLDPASSSRPDSCLRAIALVGVASDNQWFVLDMKYGRWDSAETLNIIFETVQQYGLKEFAIEKGHYQQVLEPFLLKEMKERNIYFNVIPLEHAKQGTKLERIKMLQPRFKAHTIWFPDTATWLAELKSELAGVTRDSIKSQYIDCVDALAMVEQVARPPVNARKNEQLRRSLPQSYRTGTQSLFRR